MASTDSPRRATSNLLWAVSPATAWLEGVARKGPFCSITGGSTFSDDRSKICIWVLQLEQLITPPTWSSATWSLVLQEGQVKVRICVFPLIRFGFPELWLSRPSTWDAGIQFVVPSFKTMSLG